MKLGVLGGSWKELDEAFLILDTLREEMMEGIPSENNLAKTVAMRLFNKIPMVYGSRLLEGVAYRLSTQLNENSKVPTGAGAFPEAFHNVVMGSEASRELLQSLALVILRDSRDEKRVSKKMEKFGQLFAPKVGDVIKLDSRGKGKLSRMFSLLYIGDFASTYLSFLYGLDPSANKSIDELKMF
jgi:glucose/mannose-6-phosphate isomerase